jgi:glycosyltransferase involved in cell wall biosynthesis
MTPTISIIVPVYNSAAYLRRCFDSICAQSMRDFEVVVVDDGSTDASAAICDAYAAADSRFRVFHTENHGVGVACQYAIERMQGEYMARVDSDDWVEPYMLERLYAKAIAEDADIVIADFRRIKCDVVTDYHVDLTQFPNGELTSTGFFTTIFKQLGYDLMCWERVMWNKLIRIAPIRKYNIKCEAVNGRSEDYVFLVRLLSHPLKIARINDIVYNYCNRENSLADLTIRQSIISDYMVMRFLLREFSSEDIQSFVNFVIFKMFAINALSAQEIAGLLADEKIGPAIRKAEPSILKRRLLKLASYRLTHGLAFGIYRTVRFLKYHY